VEDHSLQEKNAHIQIYEIPPKPLNSGGYYFPIEIYDDGDAPVESYIFEFSQNISDKPLTSEEENQIVSDTKKELAKFINDNKAINLKESGGYLTQSSKIETRNPKLIVTKEQYENIYSGKSYFHSIVTMVYTDKYSIAKGEAYYLEKCIRFDADTNSFMDCLAKRNFSKKKIKMQDGSPIIDTTLN
jgi:hypothetical protein